MELALWMATGVVAGVALLVGLARAVARDGYGVRAAPRSHHEPWCGGAQGLAACCEQVTWA